MKIIVISDVHGNLPALEVVLDEIERRAPDMLVVNGDLVNRGPSSLACLQRLRDYTGEIHFIRGNHEAFTLQARQQPLQQGHPFHSLSRFADWTARQLGDEALDWIQGWQDHLDFPQLEGGSSFHITHGSVQGDRDGIGERTPEDELAHKLGTPRDLFVASHTHKAMQRLFQGRIIVNTGSVGQPLDEDARASFAQFTYGRAGWQVEQIRLAYDRQRALEDYSHSGFLTRAGPMPLLIYCEHRLSRMCVGPMMKHYHAEIEAGRIELGAAIEAYLRQTGLQELLDNWKVDTAGLYE